MSYKKSLKKNFLISILRTLYVRFKGVIAAAAPGRKSIKIRNRILMMKMRGKKEEERGKARAVNVCICSTAIILGIF